MDFDVKAGKVAVKAEDGSTSTLEAKNILIATGSEVGTALEARGILAGEGISVRVVSMPSFELFRAHFAPRPGKVVRGVDVKATAGLVGSMLALLEEVLLVIPLTAKIVLPMVSVELPEYVRLAPMPPPPG